MRHWHLKDLIARAHEMTPESLSAAGVLDTPQAFVLNPDILSVDFDVGLAGTMALVRVRHLWEKTPHQPSLFYISAIDEVRNVEPRPMID